MNRLILLCLCPLSLSAATTLPVTFGGFIDTYYAYDTNAPKDHERQFTTQPVRHNEVNVNLAYIDAVLAQETTRGRLALQFGNSPTKNTSAEKTVGETSGPEEAKHIQEAFVGKKIGERTWIDVGIFLGNIGAESWISKDNWTYSRSLNLDYVPYYSAGARLEHTLSSGESIQLQVLNGWQNMSEDNSSKALGFQYKRPFGASFFFTYNNFLGDEKVVPNQKTGKFNSRFRSYHNFIFQWLRSDKWQYLMAFDLGEQSQQNNSGLDAWYAGTLTARLALNNQQSLSLRGEYYSDPHQSNVSTGTKNGFQVVGGSVNFDQKLDENALWRTELRGFHSKDKIYPRGTKYKNRTDGYLVTSLSLWF